MCVIVVPQVWFERMAEDGYDGSLLTFWVTRYFTEGHYPTGNFTWAHMWFVAYLLVMSFVCYPVFRILSHPRAKPVTDWFERTAKRDAIYLFFLLPLVLNLVLTPFFPRQTNALYNDGAWFAAWASWFGLGFLVARHHAAIIAAIVERRYHSAAFALVLTAYLYLFCFTQAGGYFLGNYDDMTPVFKLLVFALAWSMILALVGFGARYFNRESAALTWLNRKIFPLYIVHQTVVVAALYYVLPLDARRLARLVPRASPRPSSGRWPSPCWPRQLPSRLGLLVGLPARRRRAAASGREAQSPPRRSKAAPSVLDPASGFVHKRFSHFAARETALHKPRDQRQ